jgi:hypothetical protein
MFHHISIFVPNKELDCLTYSLIKLSSLDNTQECLSNSHHKIAFDYGKYTLLNITAVKLRLMHFDLIITIQVKKVLKNWYYAKSKTLLTQALMSL